MITPAIEGLSNDPPDEIDAKQTRYSPCEALKLPHTTRIVDIPFPVKLTLQAHSWRLEVRHDRPST